MILCLLISCYLGNDDGYCYSRFVLKISSDEAGNVRPHCFVDMEPLKGGSQNPAVSETRD